MKKLLISLSLILVIIMSGCVSAPQDDYVTKDEFEEYKQELAEVQDYISRMVWVGYMLPEDSLDANGQESFYVSRLGFEYFISTEKDYLDKTKFPDYIWGLDEEYIPIEEVGNLLSQKYFGVDSEIEIGFQFKWKVYKPEEMLQDEFVARLSMMIMELSEYDFYTLDSPELYIILNEGASSHFKIRMSLLTTDKYDLHPAMFWGGLMDTRIQGISYNEENVEAIYNQHIIDETFNGYVLPNYK